MPIEEFGECAVDITMPMGGGFVIKYTSR
jgi:hypothetical protein